MHQRRDGAWENPAIIRVSSELSIPGLIFDRAYRDPYQVVIERNSAGRWNEVRAEEFAADIEDAARGFYGLGVRPGDRVAILASTSYEWAMLDAAVLSLGAVTVPIYESDSAVQIRHILSDAAVSIVVTQTVQQADLVESVRPRKLREVLSLDRGAQHVLHQRGQRVPTEMVTNLRDQVTLSDLATIIYTSGTTGLPKGVLLTHGNFVETILQAYDILPGLINDRKSRTLLFLPVAHVLARFVMYAILVGEGRIGFSPDVRRLVNDIETFEPTMLLAVPRVLEKVYNTAVQSAGKGLKRTLFHWSATQARRMSVATAYPKPGESAKGPTPFPGAPFSSPEVVVSPGPSLQLRASHQLADSLVFRRIRKVLGSNLHTIICGGAPLSQELAHFYRGLGITLLQGYGLSETTGPITVELPSDNPPDSVGYLWPGNSMKLADDGELLLQGISVTSGYHNLPKENAVAFSDGWFRTGDLASIDPQGRLRITGRKKELIVTAGGKNVSPEVLEESLVTHPLIGQVVVVGDGRPHIAALLTLDAEMLPTWLRNKGLRVVSVQRAANLPEVRASIERAIMRANSTVSRAESIRRYRILTTQFSVENGYLTPSLKLKRGLVLKDFAAEITELYTASGTALAEFGNSIETTTGAAVQNQEPKSLGEAEPEARV